MNTFPLLAEIVKAVRCKPGWTFELVPNCEHALTLVVTVPVTDSRGESPGLGAITNSFPVPEATYNAKTWRRWIFECCRKVEDHELAEWFVVGDERPFAPLHGPGEDPYTVHEFRDVVDARTNQDGTVS